ncbi:MAG: hypothetical protein ACJAZA_002215, partial [Shewanella psychromarinicola]
QQLAGFFIVYLLVIAVKIPQIVIPVWSEIWNFYMNTACF